MEGVLSDFTPIEFSRRNLRQMGVVYRVYRDAKEFSEIEAASAHEALERSEIQKPFKISRYMLNHLAVLENGMLVQEEQAAETLPDQQETEQPVDAVEAAEQPAEEVAAPTEQQPVAETAEDPPA